jgi:hypothetical protein
LCDFATRYRPKPNDANDGSKSAGKEMTSTRTVEYLKMKKLKESISHTIKNKIIIIS